MAYPAGYSSDECDGFLSDDQQEPETEQVEVSHQAQLSSEQILNNLYYAIAHGSNEEVISLIENGLNVNTIVKDKWPILLLATSVGNLEVATALIRKGADVNSNIRLGKYTPLMAVCNCPESTAPLSKCLDIVTLLIENGADIEAVNYTRKTAFMFAASNGRVEIMEKLLSYNRETLHAVDNQGWNALFWAVRNNEVNSVKFLLEQGLTFERKDLRHKTPYDYALMRENEEILKLFSCEEMTDETEEVVYIDLKEFFNDSKQQPQLQRNLYRMLRGMKCKNLQKYFSNITLLDFLSLNDKKLKDLGIVLPYQREMVLNGLYMYHKHLYNPLSIPFISKDKKYSTINTFFAVISAICQLISMEASLKYVSNYEISISDKSVTIGVRRELQKLKLIAAELNSRVEMWEATKTPVDLITYPIKKRQIPTWMKWFTYVNILTWSTIFIISKIR